MTSRGGGGNFYPPMAFLRTENVMAPEGLKAKITTATCSRSYWSTPMHYLYYIFTGLGLELLVKPGWVNKYACNCSHELAVVYLTWVILRVEGGICIFSVQGWGGSLLEGSPPCSVTSDMPENSQWKLYIDNLLHQSKVQKFPHFRTHPFFPSLPVLGLCSI